MPKATRDKDENEAPKKRTRKAKPADGIGTDAADPVTTASAIAATTSEAVSEKPAPKKRASKTKPSAGNGTEVVAPPAAAAPAASATSSDVRLQNEVVGAVSAEAVAIAPSNQGGHSPEHPKHHNGHVPEELVRRRAYELYLERRGQGGSPEQDWFRALQEIRSQHVA